MTSSKASGAKPLKWYYAALIALAAPAAGYLYVGKPMRALIATLIYLGFAMVLWHGLNGWVAEPWVAYVIVATALGCILYFVVDCIRLARRSSIVRRWYSSWWLCLGAVVFWAILGSLHDIPGSGVSRSVGNYSVSSISMAPTLSRGDYFLANMRPYENSEPERGDVVVFLLPRDESVTYVKRIVGLPGETIQMIAGVLHINGKAVETKKNETFKQIDIAGQDIRFTQNLETLPGGYRYSVLDASNDGIFDNTDVFVVPDGHYFVLGDNRDYSTDSRVLNPVGYVPVENIIGKASWRTWSLDKSRIGQKIK